MFFKNKTVLITGASRGIGKAIALKLASGGANIVVVAKSVEENPALGGTIFSAAREIEQAGGNALPVACDIRSSDQIDEAVDKAVATFGGIDILINNASAINLSSTLATEPKRFDLMFDVNVRGTFMMSRACIPYLKKGQAPHILNLSPPLNFKGKWLSSHLAYTMSKYNMTMIALGLSEELKESGVSVNTLWPKTLIATAAIRNLPGGEQLLKMSRKPAIMAEAAGRILQKTSTGKCYIDEDLLKEEGISNFDDYAISPGGQLFPDLFL